MRMLCTLKYVFISLFFLKKKNKATKIPAFICVMHFLCYKTEDGNNNRLVELVNFMHLLFLEKQNVACAIPADAARWRKTHFLCFQSFPVRTFRHRYFVPNQFESILHALIWSSFIWKPKKSMRFDLLFYFADFMTFISTHHCRYKIHVC